MENENLKATWAQKINHDYDQLKNLPSSLRTDSFYLFLLGECINGIYEEDFYEDEYEYEMAIEGIEYDNSLPVEFVGIERIFERIPQEDITSSLIESFLDSTSLRVFSRIYEYIKDSDVLTPAVYRKAFEKDLRNAFSFTLEEFLDYDVFLSFMYGWFSLFRKVDDPVRYSDVMYFIYTDVVLFICQSVDLQSKEKYKMKIATEDPDGYDIEFPTEFEVQNSEGAVVYSYDFSMLLEELLDMDVEGDRYILQNI